MISANDLRSQINHYLSPILAEYRQRITRYSQPKIMRDAIWGINVYQPYELALIDSPPFQRLRNIAQTALALFTYPSAVHSRFEHSLGAAALASRMLNAIQERMRSGRTISISRTEMLEARIGALLHDLGHGPFSHSSEKFYELLTDREGDPIFKGSPNSLQYQDPIFIDGNAGEILTYLMITTESFGELWDGIVNLYQDDEPNLRDVSLDRIGRMILGVDQGVGEDVRFYRQIVNGPFDADKLDYITRDGYFTGLNISVDIERLLHTITVVEKDGKVELGVVASGASVLEQVIFSKTQLYASIYNHHKVRAAHQLFQRLLRTIVERNHRLAGMDLRDPVSYIALDDHDLLHSNHGHQDIDSIVRSIKTRALPKRALVIAYPCFDDDEHRANFRQLDSNDFIRITQQVETRLSLPQDSVIFDLPEPPRLSGTSQALVEIANNRSLRLEELYPAGAWANAFAGYRRVSYVFTTEDDRRSVGNAVREALERAHEEFPVQLNENSLALAKLE